VTLTVNTGGIDEERAQVLAQRSRHSAPWNTILVDARQAYFDQVLKYLVMGNVKRGNLYPLCVGAERVLQARRSRASRASSART
jgi:argininosuccinate synthase